MHGQSHEHRDIDRHQAADHRGARPRPDQCVPPRPVAMEPNPDWAYLCRAIATVQQALGKEFPIAACPSGAARQHLNACRRVRAAGP